MQAGPYVGYSYSYPHKTAYREFDCPRRLAQLWEAEKRDSLFLYVHIPFCEFRCGFCNLFTYSQPTTELVSGYLRAIRRQATILRREIPNVRFSRLAIGGGTPSFLSCSELEDLFGLLGNSLSLHGSAIPVSFEVSPGTVDVDKLRILHDFGVDRISMGVQSFAAHDLASLGRPNEQASILKAIALVRDIGIETLNLDLIYGSDRQSIASWTDSVSAAAEIQPEEVYLYPLYVRPLTGLANINRTPSDHRPEMYRAARDLLIDAGYTQLSMRMFRKRDLTTNTGMSSLQPDYRCQRDGMIGLGCGARSYTAACHYGTNYSVKQPSVLQTIREYTQNSDSQFGHAFRGFDLDEDERRRRFLILSLLLAEGLDIPEYEQFFGSSPLVHFPELQELVELEMASSDGARLRLTELGIEWSDAIGPWLYSHRVRQLMSEFLWSE